VSNLTIGIPSLRNVDAALDKAEWIRNLGFSGDLVVSVNDAGNLDNYMSMERAKRLSTEVYFQSSNIGLYENFEFLLRKSKSTYFMWVAIDDEPPSKWIREDFGEGDPDLRVCRLDLREFENNKLGEVKFTFSPQKYFFESSPFEIQPGFIFGVWRTEFLKKIWPSKSMDWLDSYILLAVRLEGDVGLASSDVYSSLGHTDKPPKRVNGKFHNPIGWALAVIRLLGSNKPFPIYWEFLRSLKVRVTFSVMEIFQYLKRVKSCS